MNRKTLAVWELLWPKGIPPDKFEHAMMVAGIAAHAESLRKRKVKAPVAVTTTHTVTSSVELSLRKAAEATGVNYWTLSKRVQKGTLEAKKEGRAYVVKLSDVQKVKEELA